MDFIVKLRTRMGDHDERSPPEVDEKQLDKSQVFASCQRLLSRGWLQKCRHIFFVSVGEVTCFRS